MNRYDSYKDSGVAWIGEIPTNWTMERLKTLVANVSDKVSGGSGDSPYIGLENIQSWTGKHIHSDQPISPDGTANLFQPSDFLFGKLRPYLAKAFIPDFSGKCSTELLVLRPLKAEREFLFYFSLSDRFIQVVNSSTYGAKMPRASWNFIGNLPACLPDAKQQRLVARYLDKETARIDHLIVNKRQQIKKLDELRQVTISNAVTRGLDPTAPMKDSGIDWLGVIPAHWELKRLKQVAQVRGGVAKGRDLRSRDTLSLPYIRVANVQDGYLNLEDVANIVIAHDEIERYSLKSGDVLMNEGGDFDKLGRGFIWHGQVNPCLHQNHVFAVRPFARMESEWLDLVTSSSYAKHYFILKSRQSTNLASISSTNLKGLPIVLPEKGERDKIVEYVRDKSRKFQRATQNMESQLKKLYELRKITINDAVTGKVKVTD